MPVSHGQTKGNTDHAKQKIGPLIHMIVIGITLSHLRGDSLLIDMLGSLQGSTSRVN